MDLLLAIDIGNTNITLGIFAGKKLTAHWRMESRPHRTGDEFAATLQSLLRLAKIELPVNSAVICSVVPGATQEVISGLKSWFRIDPLVIDAQTKTAMPILYENPKQVGADRIVNAVAAYEKVRGSVIVVDFGTATTFDCVSKKGEYLGGVIAPGVTLSAEALTQRTAQLPRIEIRQPESVIGRNTTESMQAGLYYGYLGLVDGVVRRIRREMRSSPRVIATGGLAPLITHELKVIDEIDELLTLRGLKILYNRCAILDRNDGTHLHSRQRASRISR